MTGSEVIRLLKKDGWVLDRVAGSHHIMIKEGQRSVPVPVHGKRGLLRAILKQSGIERK